MSSTCSMREQFVELAWNRPHYVADIMGVSLGGDINKVVEECINRFETGNGNSPTKTREFKNKRVILSPSTVFRDDDVVFMIFKMDWGVKDFDPTQ